MTRRYRLASGVMKQFPIGQPVRYKPGYGTYGYEDALEDDGRLPGVVVGHSETRVRVELTLAKRYGAKILRCVNVESLNIVPRGTSETSRMSET